MHIENLLQAVGCVGVQVGFEGISSLTVQIVVFLNQCFELLLDFYQLVI